MEYVTIDAYEFDTNKYENEAFILHISTYMRSYNQNQPIFFISFFSICLFLNLKTRKKTVKRQYILCNFTRKYFAFLSKNEK